MVEDSETLGHGLVGVAEASAGQAEEGDDGLGPVAVVAEVFQSDVALALGQFGAVGVDDQRQVREPRRLPTERPALKKNKNTQHSCHRFKISRLEASKRKKN